MPKSLIKIQIIPLYALMAIFISIAIAYPIGIATAADYDIPLSELNKVKKKQKETPKNHENRKRSKKQGERKTDKVEQEKQFADIPDSPNPSTNQNKELTSTVEAVSIAPAKEINPTSISESGSVLISHEPYSYITTGHRISIMAVLSSSENLANVTCSFKTNLSNGNITTQMTRLAGSRFTYSAILPALAEKATTLRYRINAYTEKGVEVQSREYTIPVSNSTTIIPGWQLDHFKDSLELQVEPGNEALTGFKDPALQQQSKTVKQK